MTHQNKMNQIDTGIQINLSTMQGALGLKNPDIHCDINGIANTLKFGKHYIELPVGEHTLSIKIAPLMSQAIQDQSIRFSVRENSLTCIHYKVDMFSKSSIKLEGIKEQKQEQPKEWTGAKKAAGGLGYALGRLISKSK
jgi:hypothetical protein